MINFIYSNNPTREIIEKEIEFSSKRFKENPNNESVYNYIRGIFDIKDSFGNKKFNIIEFKDLKNDIEEICKKEKNNYYCHGLLLDIEIDIYKVENALEGKQRCLKIFEDLIVMDFIRRKYWKWRKQNFIENN